MQHGSYDIHSIVLRSRKLPRGKHEGRHSHHVGLDTSTTTLDWTKPYMDYLLHGVLPDDLAEARKVKVKALQLTIKGHNYIREDI